MPRRAAHTLDEPSSKPEHYQHCLYLLAEAERMIDRTASAWPPDGVGSVRARLLQIADKLPPSLEPQ